MALTVKKQDEFEKVLESFAKLAELEKVEFPDPKGKAKTNEPKK